MDFSPLQGLVPFLGVLDLYFLTYIGFLLDFDLGRTFTLGLSPFGFPGGDLALFNFTWALVLLGALLLLLLTLLLPSGLLQLNLILCNLVIP